MTTEEQLIKLMTKRHYNLVYKSDITYTFAFNNYEQVRVGRYLIPSFTCEVNTSDAFSFSYIVPHSSNILSTPFAQPITSDELFFRIEHTFTSQAAVLQHFCK